MELSSSDKERIQHQYDALAKKTLVGEAKSHRRTLAKRAAREVPFSDLSESELAQLFTTDEYESDYFRFQVSGFDVLVKNELLAEALNALPERKRDIILLSYFLDMSDAEIGELAAKDCALFLWITFPCLCEALEVLTAWGFSYKTVAFVWVKQNRRNDDLFTGMGYWTRANAEICILATKGHPKRVDAGVRQVILSHIEEHSKKPDEARERIVRLMGDLPRVELFARQSPEGWDVWGNEVECTAHLPTEETPCCG